MAVRIAPNGRDLFVEWRQFVTPSEADLPLVTSDTVWIDKNGNPVSGRGCVGIVAVTTGVVTVIALGSGSVGVMLIAAVVCAACIWLFFAKKRGRRESLEGFQEQEAVAFQFSIRDALQEAIDDAGIAHSLLRGLDGPSGPNEPLI